MKMLTRKEPVSLQFAVERCEIYVLCHDNYHMVADALCVDFLFNLHFVFY